MDVLVASDWNTYAFCVTTVVLGVCLLVFLGVKFDKDQQRKSTIGIKNEVSILSECYL